MHKTLPELEEYLLNRLTILKRGLYRASEDDEAVFYEGASQELTLLYEEFFGVEVPDLWTHSGIRRKTR